MSTESLALFVKGEKFDGSWTDYQKEARTLLDVSSRDKFDVDFSRVVFDPLTKESRTVQQMFDEIKSGLQEFEDPPSTIQRLTELLMDPFLSEKRIYKDFEKYLTALGCTLAVSLTIHDYQTIDMAKELANESSRTDMRSNVSEDETIALTPISWVVDTGLSPEISAALDPNEAEALELNDGVE